MYRFYGAVTRPYKVKTHFVYSSRIHTFVVIICDAVVLCHILSLPNDFLNSAQIVSLSTSFLVKCPETIFPDSGLHIFPWHKIDNKFMAIWNFYGYLQHRAICEQ